MRKGSITPFCAISLMFVVALLLVLLESGRVYVLERFAKLKAEAGMDSVCAEYQPLLWQQYGMLFLDGAYGAEHFSMNYVSERLEEEINRGMKDVSGLNFLSFKDTEAMLLGYALATDKEGETFLNYVAEREKENLPMGVAEDLYEQYKDGKQMEEQHSDAEAEMEKAELVVSEVLVDSETKEKCEEMDISSIEETWNNISFMKNNGALNLILGDVERVSKKGSQPQNMLEEREMIEGNLQVVREEDWYRKLLVLHYMEHYFSNYLQAKPEHYLSYEMEYVLCGKDMEWKNLDGALERILWLREAYNIVALTQDKGKMLMVEGIARGIGLLAGENEAVVKTLQAGLVAAWAYIESVLDVRALVAGDRIPLVKSEQEWTTDISNLWCVFSDSAKAKSCEKGMTYRDYLKQLLFFTSDKKLAYRMMEVMEFSMQNKGVYSNGGMHHMIIAMQYQVRFQTDPLFSALVSWINAYEGKFCFEEKVSRSYVP